MKKVLVITYYWAPSGGAGVQRWLKFVKYLPDFGWEPVVLTVKEESASYAQKDKSLEKEVDPLIKVIRTSTFEPYSLYLKVSGKKEIPYGGFSNEGNPSFFQKVSRFIRGNFFIPDPRRGWNYCARKGALQLLEREKYDAIITTGPPQSTHLIGLYLKKKTGINWIADFRDPWTDIYYYKGLLRTRLARWYDKKLEKKILDHCDHVVTVGNEIKELLSTKTSSLMDKKFEVITNGYDSSDFEGFGTSGESDRFIITYTGTISNYYRIEGFVSALTSLPDELRSKVFIRFVGSISSPITALFTKAGLASQLEFISYVPHRESIGYLYEASVLLLIIPDVEANKGILTGKFFEYLATGKPVLAIGPVDGEVARILKETRAGFMADYNDSEAIREKITEWYAGFINGITSSPSPEIEKYSRKNLTEKLVKLLEKRP